MGFAGCADVPAGIINRHEKRGGKLFQCPHSIRTRVPPDGDRESRSGADRESQSCRDHASIWEVLGSSVIVAPSIACRPRSSACAYADEEWVTGKRAEGWENSAPWVRIVVTCGGRHDAPSRRRDPRREHRDCLRRSKDRRTLTGRLSRARDAARLGRTGWDRVRRR
jgi:hypothetical protein